MTEEEKNTRPGYEEEAEGEMDLLEYWQVIWKRRRLISCVVFVIVLGAIVFALTRPNIFQANAIIIPVSAREAGSGTGAVTALAAQIGGIPGITPPGLSSAIEIVNLLRSNILKEKIIRRYQLMPVFFPEQWDAQRKDWKRGSPGLDLNPLNYIRQLLTSFAAGDQQKGQKMGSNGPDIWEGIRRLDDIARINHSIRENLITISVNYTNPETAARIVEYYLTTLTDHMSSEAKRVALVNRKYLEAELGKTGDPLIKQRIYTMIAQQVETSMMAEVKENFSFKVIDPPKVPDERIAPKRTRMVLLSLVAALFIGIFLAFFLEYLKKRK